MKHKKLQNKKFHNFLFKLLTTNYLLLTTYYIKYIKEKKNYCCIIKAIQTNYSSRNFFSLFLSFFLYFVGFYNCLYIYISIYLLLGLFKSFFFIPYILPFNSSFTNFMISILIVN